MSESQQIAEYFIRRRGRISGPFDHSVVEKMAKNNKLYKTDELSTDQDYWVTAGDTEFFPSHASRGNVQRSGDSKQSRNDAAGRGDEHEDDDANTIPLDDRNVKPSAPAPPAMKQWYYALSDQTFGPVSENDLKMQLMLKTLSPNTKIWTEGMPDWIEATQYPGFFSVFQSDSSSARPINQQPALNPAGGILQGKYCIGCGNVISHRANICPKCGASQETEDNSVSANTIKVSYILTFFFPPAGFIYLIFFLIKSKPGHAIGNLVLGLFMQGFWIAFFEEYLKNL